MLDDKSVSGCALRRILNKTVGIFSFSSVGNEERYILLSVGSAVAVHDVLSSSVH